MNIENPTPKLTPVKKTEVKRTEFCPQCGARVIQPRDSKDYCEECGWPDENRAAEQESNPPAAAQDLDATPRTDELIDSLAGDDENTKFGEVVAFARSQEMELNVAKAEIERLRAAVSAPF